MMGLADVADGLLSGVTFILDAANALLDVAKGFVDAINAIVSGKGRLFQVRGDCLKLVHLSSLLKQSVLQTFRISSNIQVGEHPNFGFDAEDDFP